MGFSKFTFFVTFVFYGILIHAQQLSGVVYEGEENKPLSNVKVQIENSEVWTVTSEDGTFNINYKPGETLLFTRFGLIDKRQSYSTLPNNKVAVVMLPSSIRIQEVSISAKRRNYSEIEIKEEALKTVQAFSLNEVLETLPGQRMSNLTLNEFKPIVFRSVLTSNVSGDGFGNKSFGTAIVVDGIPISNNENMQQFLGNFGSVFSPNTLGFGVSNGYNGYFTNTNYGADLRELPVENIEKVEIVQGVASVKYGDMTSGLINITQKKGTSPYRFYVAVQSGTQEYNINKGFKISDKLGFLNVNLNYLESNSDPRTKFNVFKRYNTSLIWSVNSKDKRISNSFSFNYSNNFDDANFEEEDTNERITYNKNRKFSIGNNLKWRFKNQFFDNLDFRINYTQGYQYSHDSRLVNTGGDVIGTSTTEGVYTGAYSPVSYREAKEVEGKPVSIFSGIDLSKKFTIKEWMNNFSVGTSFRYSDNLGRGRLGAPETLPVAITSSTVGSGAVGFRPFNFGEEVRPETQFSVYAEDNIFRKFANAIFNISAGIRADYQNETLVLAPRINSYYIYKNLKLRAGFGISSKAPSMNMIYTGPRYYDVILADVRLPNYYNIGVVQTYVDFANNPDLKPSRSTRSELGVDYKFPFGNISLTGYYNRLFDGFTSQAYASRRELAQLQFNYNGTQTPTYDVIGYSDYFYTQSKIVNALESTDKGLELLSSIHKLPIANVSLDVQGSYVITTNNSNTDRLIRSKDLSQNEIYGLYKSYETTFRQLSLGGSLNYHLPKLGLIVSLRSQHFIFDDYRFDNPGLAYAYVTKDLQTVMMTQEEINNPSLLAHIKTNDRNEVEENNHKVFHNFNLRITKDFLNGFRFSFYANNFLDLKQTQTEFAGGTYYRTVRSDLQRLSFGAKIEYEF